MYRLLGGQTSQAPRALMVKTAKGTNNKAQNYYTKGGNGS